MYDSLKTIDSYISLERELKEASAPLAVTGCMDSQKIQLTAKLSEGYSWVLYITADEQTASGALSELNSFSENVRQYPAKDLLFYSSDIQSKYLDNQRTEILRTLIEDKKGIVTASADALMDRIPAREALEDSVLKLYEGMVIEVKNLSRALTSLGYERRPSVEAMGEFSVRGGIVDIYPMTSEAPYRVEFFDDEIDTIRSFDTLTQRSVELIKEIELFPVGDRLPGGGRLKEVSLLDYFGKDAIIILDDPVRIRDRAAMVEAEFAESMENRAKKGLLKAEASGAGINEAKDKSPTGTGKEATEDGTNLSADIFSAELIMEKALSVRSLLIAALDEPLKEFGADKSFHFNTAAVGQYKDSFEMLISDIRNYQKNGYRITVLTPSRTRASRIAEELRNYDIRAFCPDEGTKEELKQGETEVVQGSLKQGFIYTDIKYVLMTEADMFGRSAIKKRRKKFSGGEALSSLNELKPGDYVVHENHGIGIYRGLEHIVRDDVGKDYIKIEYADGGNLYLPATKLDLIQKYAGGEAPKIKLNKLNGNEWAKTRQRVNHAVQDIAKDLIKLYSSRLNSTGYKYGPDTVWQTEFEEMFPYEETEDQLNAIAQVKADMESSHIMDRLICGDVGYGKTEIAMRAAFKAVQEGKQAAVLVPTTILAQQHYKTFSERLGKFPVEIAMMSRFRTSEQNKKTAEKLKNGQIDIVIGTHRLLSKDVSFKDLGLLIIDEEQRFGVAHKEKIKQLKTNVEALSLTATPIPRTLHMSLAGIRDLSILEEPPFDRIPVQTYVLEYNDEFVREAISREIARKGQVFYVYNKVRDIAEKCDHIRSLMPDARVELAHGQMNERELENIMSDFVNGDIDVLVATTIVETGLDIPNANTLIIDGAERMGLSQLYQLRGRVGRSNRTAYAFFMYRKDKILSEEAEKRLKAIREFTEFGAGIKIAMRDLEIRGAGNVLGAEQHGEMQAVGYDLYCKLLSKAVRLEKGEEEEKPEFETSVDLDIDAFIPADYIEDEYQKLDIYKRISELNSEEGLNDMTDELVDRYGDVPKEVMALMRTALLKTEAHEAYVTELKIKEGSITIQMYPRAEIDVSRIPELIEKEEGRLKFITGANPRFIYNEEKGAKRDIPAMMKKARELISVLRSNA